MDTPKLYPHPLGNSEDKSELMSSLRSTIEHFFPENKVSLGALKRKLPFLLLQAVSKTSLAGYCVVLLNEEQIQYEAVFGFISVTPNGWIYGLPLNRKTATAKVRTYFDSIFKVDKFVTFPTTWAKVRLNTNLGTFIYERSRGEDVNYGGYWSFTVTPVKSTWKERFTRYFRRKSEEEIEVITATLQENAPNFVPVLPNNRALKDLNL